MRSARRFFALFVVLSLSLLGVPTTAPAADNARRPASTFELYTGVVTADAARELRQRFDHDVLDSRVRGDGRVTVDVILNSVEHRKLAARGITLKLKRDAQGNTATQAAALALQAGTSVFRPYSGAGNIEEEIRAVAAANPGHTKLITIGDSINGQPILALKVTKDATATGDGSRPAALYLGTQHAREWISPEVTRRLMHHFVDGYGSDATLTALIDANEYWFVPVANPDGYDWTFEPDNRLWRKNLRDNDGDGFITADLDGVDLNRNFATHWGYDDEGSSPALGDATYRGLGGSSEPETQALDALMAEIKFNYLINYHSAAELLLYGVGWQVQTPTPDDAVYETLAGTDAAPAIEGYDPDLSAELYITNGDTTDHAHETYKTLAFTPELSECQSLTDPTTCGSVFHFPDDEALVQAEFDKNLPFAMDIAKSTPRPDRPVSHLNNRAPNFRIDPFAHSYGDGQPVAVTAARRLGEVKMRYSINDGPAVTVDTQEWDGGDRYGDTNDVHYAEFRGVVTGSKPSDKVKVWFVTETATSKEFVYQVVNQSDDRVLVLANEDYTGPTPAYANTKSPTYLSYYTQALDTAGIGYDVYDVDARSRLAPHHLGVLSHYDSVVWYTGDDYLTRRKGQRPGTGASKLASDIMLSVRDYLNEGGTLVYTGQRAGQQHAEAFDFNVAGEPPYCPPTGNASSCIPLSNDFLQYYLGAWSFNAGAGISGTAANPIVGTAAPFDGFSETPLNGIDSARNQQFASSLLVTSDFLPAADFPQFTSSATLEYARQGGAPYEPHNGDQYVFSQTADVTYKRLTRTIDLTSATTGQLSFWLSADTEPDWDYVAVEAHTVGQENWTTLPDAGPNHLTSTSTGDSCPEGWEELHPQLAHYQTRNADGTCSPTGTSGVWNAFEGNSAGWKEFVADLSAYSGQQVEVSISYINDWSTQNLGVFIDDATVTVDGAPSATGFETDLGGWTVPGPPPGSADNANDWILSPTAFTEGAGVSTPHSHYWGFGLEGVTGAAARADLLGRALEDLLGG